jgi:hypothetical protein
MSPLLRGVLQKARLYEITIIEEEMMFSPYTYRRYCAIRVERNGKNEISFFSTAREYVQH